MTVLTDIDLAESLGLAESSPIVDFDLQLAEAFGIIEAGAIDPLIELAESIGMTDAEIFDSIVGLLETLEFGEFVPFNSEFILSNMKIVDFAMNAFTFGEFAKADRVIGFEPFSRFIPGDKLYQTAILRLIVRAPTQLGDDRIGIGKTVLNVDVPDTLDGNDSVAIPNVLTTVNFVKTFHVIPSVTVTVHQAATISVVNISNITLTSFDVIITDVKGAQLTIAGTIDWTARGY